MKATAGCLSMLRAARYGVALVLVVLLAGCATTPGGPSPLWNPEAPPFRSRMLTPAAPRALAAMSGGPTVLGTPSGPAAGGESSGPTLQGYNVPGRNPDSRMPWKLFLGGASHRLIAYMYGLRHPTNRVYNNNKPVAVIIAETGIGKASLLLPDEGKKCPDIADVTRRVLFEIKPWHERGLEEGREKARMYLAALNRTILVGKRFTGGTDFHGEILIRFARGQYIWRLEWKTTEPGVVQYEWTRSKERFESEAEAYAARQWTDIKEEELRQYGGWVEKAVEDMVSRREKLTTFSGAVGLVIDSVGEVAKVVLWGAILGQMGSGPGVQQPPARGGGQVIPFPARTPPAAPPAQVPAAARMPLPH